MSSQRYPRCPRCGGRLFQESEFLGNRLLYFWECSLGCSRQFDEQGREQSHKARGHRVRVVGELTPVW